MAAKAVCDSSEMTALIISLSMEVGKNVCRAPGKSRFFEKEAGITEHADYRQRILLARLRLGKWVSPSH